MIKRTHHLLLVICFLCSLTQSLRAQEQFASRYNISYTTMDDGLLHNFIDYLYKDQAGFLWIATGGGGLSRYDGYEFIHFNTNSFPVNLRSNFIISVCEDNFQRLWIVSSGGTDIIDLKRLQHATVQSKAANLSPILQEPAVHAIKDSEGNIWLYSGTSLRKITFDSYGTITSIATLPHIPSPPYMIALNDIDQDGNIWMGIGNHVYKVRAEGERLEATPLSPLLQLEAGTIVSALCLKENEVWIGTNQGLYRYNRNEEVVKRYEYRRDNPRSISQSYITDIAVTKDKQLLISTLRGVNIYNPITDDFDHIAEERRSTGSHLNSSFINCMMIDEEIVWIGSESGGINKMTPRRLSLQNYMYNKENPHSLSKNPVNAIYEDHRGDVWIGTVEGGLNRKVKGSDRFIHYTTDTPVSISHNSVSAITSDHRNRLWVGTWGLGITLLDLHNNQVRTIRQLSSATNAAIPNFIGSLCYDPINKGIWIGANPGIYFYDIEADSLITPFAPEVINGVYGAIGSIVDSSGILWMGSMEGIFLIDLRSRHENRFAYKHLKYKLNECESNITERASCFFEASDGTVWVGSNGNGFYRHQRAEIGVGTFTNYNTEHGLINNNVRGILEDNQGQLWISTNYGLSCFNPTTGRFTNYTKEDGLPNNQFYWNAFCKASNGRMYFGGISGLSAIEGIRPTEQKRNPKVRFTRLRVMNEEIYAGNKEMEMEADISMTKELHLHERDNSFSLEFSALNYNNRPTAVYSYRLVGFEDGWVDVSATRRFAGYTNIPPGRYTFQVKYALDGNTNRESEITELAIVIKPFFYKTWWFMFLVILIVGCTIISFYMRRLYKLQQQKELLHRMVEERTHELKEQNEKVNKQKTQLIEMSKKVQELTLDKLSFFTNITHEFRTPITLIIGPIERALKLSYNPQVIEQLHFVERNSKYLLSLVNQLMDFRKVESGNLEITRTNGDFLKFADSLIVPFEVFAAERNIRIHKYYRMSNATILFDQDAMQKVITNLLSNAVKFTPDGGSVSLYVLSLSNKETGSERLFIGVRDNGIGIPEEELGKIFNRFYQSQNNVRFPIYGQSGTGIGLYLSARIVKLHGGTITARNNRQKGSTFSIMLPLTRDTGSTEASTPAPDKLIAPLSESINLMPSHFKPDRLTILIVEDNKDMRSYIRSVLEERYNIFEAAHGAEALNILTTSNVDFIISDLMMPVMDGNELSRKVKQNFSISHIPFLMLTAKTSQESRIESYRTGVDEYLLKPFSEELLLTRINNILENRKRYQQRFAANMEIEELQIEEKSSDKKFLDKALEIVRANYKNSYYESNDFIEAMGVSKSLLNKKIQSLTGQSIGQFIRNYRLNVARELIEKNRSTRNMNISEIAYEVGFNDPKYFTRCFTKRYNVTPSSLFDNG